MLKSENKGEAELNNVKIEQLDIERVNNYMVPFS